MEKNKSRRKPMRRLIRSRPITRRQTKQRSWSNHKIELRTLKDHEDEFPGQYVIIIGKDIVGSKNGKELVRLFREMERRHPGKTPLISFVLEKDMTYIFCVL